MKLRFFGTAKLREDYANSKSVKYYLVLSGHFSDIGKCPEVEDIPFEISQQDYNKLKGDLSSSKAEFPFLDISGDLELSVKAACIN